MEQPTIETDDKPDIDKLIEYIGNAGLFQKRFNFIFNCLISILLAMPYLNLIMSLAVPDHWCHVPGRNLTNHTLQEWKQLTIPKKMDSNGNLDYSKCTRFANISNIDMLMDHNDGIIKCNRGWEYDHTWYDLTAPMQNDWVCDHVLVPSNTMAISRAGEVIGPLIFGQLSDNVGRMPIFFITLTTVIVGRTMSVFTSSWIYLFQIASFIGSVSGILVFQGPFIITIEISRADHRANIGFTNVFYWSIGIVILPIFMWVLRDWVYFMLITTLPTICFVFALPWFIESPRWLVSKGKIKQCIRVFAKIARTNQTEVPYDIRDQLTRIHEEQNNAKVHTVMSLFSSWRLCKNALILIYSTSTILTMYLCLTINVGTMSGNPFLQYIFQGFAEIPSYFIGKWICNRYGRRCTIFIGFVLATIGCIFSIFYVHDASNYWIVSMACVFIKFSFSISMFAITIMNLKIYPTCIRQTGTSINSIVGSLFSILAPYIIALGVSVGALIPFVIYSVTFFLGSIFCLFLPETREMRLPETLKDAAVFGRDQNIWGKTKTQFSTISSIEI